MFVQKKKLTEPICQTEPSRAIIKFGPLIVPGGSEHP
jgi:hypothetical protein